MDMTQWLRGWLSRHPLQEPAQSIRARYTADVMSKVRAAAGGQEPRSALHWLRWPQVAFAAASAVAVGLVVVALTQSPLSPSHRLVAEIDRDARLLAELNVPVVHVPMNSVEALSRELQDLDAIMLAESSGSEEDAWLDETLQLLRELDEDVPEDATGEPANDRWLEELQILDETDLAASS